MTIVFLSNQRIFNLTATSPTETFKPDSTIPSIQIINNDRLLNSISSNNNTQSPTAKKVLQFPVFTFSDVSHIKSDQQQSNNSNQKVSSSSDSLKRPEYFMRTLSSIASADGLDTPSPKSPLSQANYLCPKESTKLDLNELIDLLKLDTDENNCEIKTSSKTNGLKAPILTLSDVKLEVRIKSIERILISLMQKVSCLVEILKYF